MQIAQILWKPKLGLIATTSNSSTSPASQSICFVESQEQVSISSSYGCTVPKYSIFTTIDCFTSTESIDDISIVSALLTSITHFEPINRDNLAKYSVRNLAMDICSYAFAFHNNSVELDKVYKVTAFADIQNNASMTNEDIPLLLSLGMHTRHNQMKAINSI